MKNTFKTAAHLFIPIKGYDTVGVYQRTIAYSLCCCCVLMLLSVFLEYRYPNNRVASFIENYAIGISCSFIVVVITSVLMFCNERDKRAKQLFGILTRLFAYLIKVISSDHAITDCKMEYMYRSIEDEFNELDKVMYSLFWYSILKNNEYLRLAKELVKLRSPFLQGAAQNNMKSSIDKESVLNALRSAKMLSGDYYTTIFDKYIEILNVNV